MDEPLTALDPARRDELMDYIARIPGVWKVPILYVTHSVEEALRLAPSTLLVPARPSGCLRFHGRRSAGRRSRLRKSSSPSTFFPPFRRSS